MELYEYARPGLMAGKKILLCARVRVQRAERECQDAEAADAADSGAGAGSAGGAVRRDGVVEEYGRVRKAGSDCRLLMGGAMYAEMRCTAWDRILVNPAFQLADTLLKNNGLGRQEFHNPRQDGETSFLVTKTLLEHFREVSSHCFERASEDQDKVFGLYGKRDTLVHTFDLFSGHYPQAVRFDGEHYLNDEAILHSLLPVIQWIDDRQNGVQRPVLFISLSDRIINHSSGFHKAVATLAADYDIHIVAGVPYNNPELCQKVFGWCEENLGVPCLEPCHDNEPQESSTGRLSDRRRARDQRRRGLHGHDDPFRLRCLQGLGECPDLFRTPWRAVSFIR